MSQRRRLSAKSIRYIGSKARVTDEILSYAGPPNGGRFVDLFCGTGVVSRKAALCGWPIVANDSLLCAAVLTEACLVSEREASFENLGGYWKAVEALEKVAPRTGFITREYSPASSRHCGVERRYFTIDNARRIDGIRFRIEEWSRQNLVGRAEKIVLLADLIEAANSVANIAGTYGCFLRSWTRASLSRLSLEPRTLLPFNTQREVNVGDALEAACLQHDLVYLDPPYTKRQYAAYYHLIETIAAGDEPNVSGVCGLRPWQHLSSPFCYKRRAVNAMVDLVLRLPARRVLISYSSEGHINLDELRVRLSGTGNVSIHKLREVGRYRPNATASANGMSVNEYLVEFQRFGHVQARLRYRTGAIGSSARQLELSL